MSPRSKSANKTSTFAMYCTALILATAMLVGGADSEGGDLDAIMQDLGNFSTTTETSTKKALILTTAMLVGGADIEGGDLDAIMQTDSGNFSSTTEMSTKKDIVTCTTSDKRSGECVAYYQCNENNTINTDGDAVIDIRFGAGPCPSYLDVCCATDDMQVPRPTPTTSVQRPGCGWRNPVGAGFFTTGDVEGEAKFAEFPWVIAVLKAKPMSTETSMHSYDYVGGGSLIHPSVVLTAAHVLHTERVYARAGEWDTQTEKEPYPHQQRDVVKIVVHEQFKRKNLNNDIALLFLNLPMELTLNVGLACLPEAQQAVPAGTRCLASGWGKSNFEVTDQLQVILKKVELPIVDREVCQRQLRDTRLGPFFLLHPTFICAGGEPGKDMCKGDGGAPLVCPIPLQIDRYVHTGMVAWGIDCGSDKTPGVYVDVAYLRDWIDTNVAAEGYDTSVYTFKL